MDFKHKQFFQADDKRTWDTAFLLKIILSDLKKKKKEKKPDVT